MAAKKDYYEVLGIKRDADDAAIKKAYRKLAKKYHPDSNGGNAQAEQKFKEVTEAYTILSDPEKRKLYDRFGHAAFDGTGAAAEGAGSADGFYGFGGNGGFDGFRGSVAALEMVPDLPADIRSIILKAEIWMIFSMACLAECLEKHQEAKLPEPMVLAAVPGGAVLTGADLTREILTGAVLARVIFLKAVSAGAGI